ncbi:hypothetical protein ACHHYP_03503 [Achlya hypogyna]|uniref:Potassium channel tetramerisation-type BTB domain-containing protein n=1 Tax=Achlya hypogyna TaxID=1202772 RepID=A0A1V9Z3J3_ACHHY|nr:hypothetical protein ACHHYP_03503 [Achlya hypogyna]
MGFVHEDVPIEGPAEKPRWRPEKKCRFKHGGFMIAAGLVAWLSWSIQGLSQMTYHKIEIPQESLQVNATVPPTVKLNVGGTVFETTWSTLLKCDETYFHDIQKDVTSDGTLFVDWSPTHMERVLMYLRSGYLNRHGLLWWEDDELSRTMRFLKIDTKGANCPFAKALEEPQDRYLYDYDEEGVPMTKTPHVCAHGVPGCDELLMPEPTQRQPVKARNVIKKAKNHPWRY